MTTYEQSFSGQAERWQSLFAQAEKDRREGRLQDAFESLEQAVQIERNFPSHPGKFDKVIGHGKLYTNEEPWGFLGLAYSAARERQFPLAMRCIEHVVELHRTMQDEVSKAREKTAGQPQNGEWDKGFEESVVAGTEGCWGLANLAIRVGEPEWGAKFYHRRAELLGKGTHGEDKWLADFCLDQAHKECHPFAFWQEERLPRFEVIERFLKVALSADFDLHEKREMLLVLSILVRTACEAGQFSWGEQYVEHTLSAMPDLKDTVVADCYFYLLKCAVHQKISELQSIRYAVQAKDIIVTGGVMDEFAKLAKDAAEIGQIRLAWVCLRRMVEVSTAKDAAETLASTTAREIGIAF